MDGFIRADLHFHANFGSSPSEAKAVRILENCLKHRITALVVSEHDYKDPKDAFTTIYSVQQRLIRSKVPHCRQRRALP